MNEPANFNDAVEKHKNESGKSWFDSILSVTENIVETEKSKSVLEQLVFSPSNFNPKKINRNAENQ